MATSTWDNVRDDNGGEGSGDVSSMSEVFFVWFLVQECLKHGITRRKREGESGL